jgi:hypothetical protein
MKNLKIILITIVVTFLGFSCEDDGGTSVIPLNDGAVPNMVKSATSADFFDLVKVNAGENVSVTFSADVAQGNPASVDVVGIYRSSLGPVYAATLFSNVSLPQDFNLSISDIVTAFAEINSSDDILVGDALTITLRFTMADGTVLNIINDDGNNNVGTNIQTNVDLFTYKIDYFVSCPSMLEGTHSYVSTDFTAITGTCPVTPTVGTVTWTNLGGGQYLVSDLGFGQYGTTCWNDTPATSGAATFVDVCGTITSGGLDQYGLTYIWVITDVNGPELTMTWTNNYGDGGTVVLTREGSVDWPALSTN